MGAAQGECEPCWPPTLPGRWPVRAELSLPDPCRSPSDPSLVPECSPRMPDPSLEPPSEPTWHRYTGTAWAASVGSGTGVVLCHGGAGGLGHHAML